MCDFTSKHQHFIKKLRSRLSVSCNSSDTVLISPNIYAQEKCKLQIQMESLSVPHIWYNIPFDALITFTNSASVVSQILIPAGNYDLNTFLTLLTGQMDLNDVPNIYVFSISLITFTWTINNTVPGPTFQLVFPINLARRLGTLGTTGPVNSLTSGRFSFTQQNIYVFSSITHAGDGTSYSNLRQSVQNFFTTTPTVTEASNFIIVVPIVSLPGEIENIYLGDIGPTYMLASGNNQVQFLLTDELGQILDVTPQKVQLSMIYSVLGEV